MKVSLSAIFWGVISIAVGLFLVVGSWGIYLQYKKVQDYEGRSLGHITGKYFKMGSDEGSNYYIDYWFMTFAGSKVSSKSVIAKQQWDILKVNETIEIRYAKSNPANNIPMNGGGPSLIFAFFMMVLGSVFLLFGALRIINSFKKSFPSKSH